MIPKDSVVHGVNVQLPSSFVLQQDSLSSTLLLSTQLVTQ